MMNWYDPQYLITKIFSNDKIIINVYDPTENEINLNSETESVAANQGSYNETVHSSNENEINGLTYIDININCGANQILFEIHRKPTEIEIEKLFGHRKHRFRVKLDERNIEQDITEFLKTYVVPKVNYYCLFQTELLQNQVDQIIRERFEKGSIKLIKCKQLLQDLENEAH